MKEIKLILNIQLFAEGADGDAGENGECGMRNSEFEMSFARGGGRVTFIPLFS